MEQNSVTKHGGKRPGAGRPKTLGTTKQVVVRVPKKDDDKIQAFAKLHSVTVADVYRQAVRDFVLLHEEAIAEAEGLLGKSP